MDSGGFSSTTRMELRRTIYLGKIPQRGADIFKGKVEALVAAILTMTPLDIQTVAWVGKLEDAMYEKLVAVNLLPARKSATKVVELTLAQFLDDFIETRKKGSNAKGTITNLGQTRRLLVEFFGTSQPLKTITPRRCDEWRIFLEGKGLATATISRHVKLRKGVLPRGPPRQVAYREPNGRR